MRTFLLLIVAAMLFAVLAPLGILATLVLICIQDHREQFSNFADYPFGIAHSIDILGNVVCGDLFNMTMIKHTGYRFGQRGETVSSALGRNAVMTKSWQKYRYKMYIRSTVNIRYKYCPHLTGFGNLVYNILDAIDPNHCIKSIQNIN